MKVTSVFDYGLELFIWCQRGSAFRLKCVKVNGTQHFLTGNVVPVTLLEDVLVVVSDRFTDLMKSYIGVIFKNFRLIITTFQFL